MVNVITHISKLKGVAEITNKTEQNKTKIKIEQVQVGSKFYHSSRLFKPRGSSVPAQSI